jgi:RNA-binding protein
LEPRVQIGHGGLSARVIAEVDRALTAHELIKVKFLDADRHERGAMAAGICEKTDAALVQQVGKVAVLWRPNPEESV